MCVCMASDESMTVISSMQEEEEEEEEEEEDDDDEVDGVNRVMTNYMSRLSIESFGADSDDEEEESFDSNKGGKHDCYYSLPSTPPPRRRSRGRVVRDYASESEARKSPIREKRRRIIREEGEDTKSVGGERDHAGAGAGAVGGGGGNGGVVAVVVMTRPKGGSRSLCMDMEEVKACRDLGFELEHERMLEMPLSQSAAAAASTLETATSGRGGTSPKANWRISSPG